MNAAYHEGRESAMAVLRGLVGCYEMIDNRPEHIGFTQDETCRMMNAKKAADELLNPEPRECTWCGRRVDTDE
jgi:hypothetical protein